MGGVKRLSALFLLVLLVGAQSTLKVPAVLSDGGGMMTHFECRAVTGKGGVYMDVEPFISVDTQESAKDAVRIAAKYAGVDSGRFDVLYKIVADAEIVDGPSGGAALALLAYAEFSGQKPRADMAVTGSIERDGSIGKISGLRRKLDAVRVAGLNLFVVPRGQIVQNGVDLAELGDRMGVQVVEASDLIELASFAFTPEGYRVNASTKELPPLDLYSLDVRGDNAFKPVVEKEWGKLEKRLPQLDGVGRELAETALNESLTLLDKGYYYSAANQLFLVSITLDRVDLEAQNLSKKGFADLLDLLEAEINDFTPKNKSLDNWELVYGAEARLAWAGNNLELLREDYAFYGVDALLDDYVSARAWLRAANSMNDLAAPGTGFDEFKLRDYALEWVTNANASAESTLYASLDYEVNWHSGGMATSFSNGAYAAAVFDACFVESFVEANRALDETIGEKSVSDLVAGPEELSEYGDALWAELYFAHSLYNWQEANRTGEYSYKVNAVKLQRLSHCLATTRQGMLTALQAPDPTPSPEPSPQKPVFSVEVERVEAGSAKWVFLAALLFLVAGTAFLILCVRHKIRRGRGKPKLTHAKRIGRLDDLLLEGRISEATYKRLRKKYSVKKK